MLRFRSLIPALAGAIFINAWTTACAAPFAYVPNEKSGSVSVIDIGNGAGGAVVRQIAAGKRPRGIAVAPDGGQVWVSNVADGSVMAIDTARNAVKATVAVGKRPWNMALTPDGRRLYVANGRSDSVSVIDTAGAAGLADIPVGQLPWGVVIR